MLLVIHEEILVNKPIIKAEGGFLMVLPPYIIPAEPCTNSTLQSSSIPP